ncbi:MAG TPA: hypothetical protein VK668_12795 [Mucilaginibacter sp.]|nr:hypothetical protein [Mucilaginibacter sp.]
MAGNDQKTIRIGITGHRHLTAGQSSALEAALKRVIENIINYYQETHNSIPAILFTSPIAIGADTLFVNVALKYFEGGLRIYLPFEKQEYLNDFEKPEDIKEFERLLNEPRVTEVKVVNKLSPDNRDELYLQVGKQMVDTNDYIIAVWDEEKAKGKGGTADIVNYAVSLKKNVLVINPDDENMVIKGSYLPHLTDCPDDQPKLTGLSDNVVEDYFDLYDSIAITNQVAYKRIWRLCFRIGWLGAALILSIKVAFDLNEDLQFLLTVAEIICLVVVFGLIWREKRKSYHKKYLLCRFIAERLRINNLIYSCGYYPIKTHTKVIHKALQDIESKYPVDLINKIIRLTSYSAASLAQKKATVQSFADNQGNYHARRKQKLEKENKRNLHIKVACIIIFIAVIIYHTIHEFPMHGFSFKNIFSLSDEKHDLTSGISFLLYLFIPTTLARFEAIKYINDWERLITQSTYMNNFFTEISDRINDVRDDGELNKLLIELNDNVYLENLDWEMFMTNKNEAIT